MALIIRGVVGSAALLAVVGFFLYCAYFFDERDIVIRTIV
jgi:hypothetical protein